MKITTAWLKDHLDTKLNENQIIDKLTDIGLEVEGVDSQSGELDEFIIAKILKAEKHPDADRLRVCDVDIGSDNPVKVVCGAPNAKEGLLTIYNNSRCYHFLNVTSLISYEEFPPYKEIKAERHSSKSVVFCNEPLRSVSGISSK